MNGHLRVLGIKTLAIVVFSALLTPFFTDLPMSHGIVTGVVLSVIAYFLGDLLILPHTNNTIATGADIVIAALVYRFGVTLYKGTGLSMGELIFFSLVVGVSEWFLHKYIKRVVHS
ncbi:MAG: DUF2512 family protein [Desulfocucumaceae bacterium]